MSSTAKRPRCLAAMHSLAALHICTSAGHVLGFSNARTASPHRPPAEFTRYAPQPLRASIRVYDNVAPTDTCRRLHKLTLESTQRGTDGSFVFHRGTSGHQPSRLTPIETAIDQILTSLNDTSPIVEYWSRSEYINLDAHADIDENTLKEDGVLRCPRHGHVLYMQIANDPNIRVGPTVVFPERKVAWGTVTPRKLPSPNAASYNSQANVEERAAEYVVDVENYWDDEQKRQYGYEIDTQSVQKDEMAIVPAVTGRLLRFDGSAFHAVPKPPDRYLLSEKELSAYLDKECEEDCDDEDSYWDDDYDEYDDGDEEEDEEDKPNRRSVLLFNTWPEGSGGPRGVDTDTVVLEAPMGSK